MSQPEPYAALRAMEARLTAGRQTGAPVIVTGPELLGLIDDCDAITDPDGAIRAALEGMLRSMIAAAS